MIVAQIEHPKEGRTVLIVLEPANPEKLRLGQPIPIKLEKFGLQGTVLLGFSPDVAFVAEQVQKHGKPLTDAIESSLHRPDVYQRDHAGPEALAKIPGTADL